MSEKNYILIAMNYMRCNFKELKDEWDNKKKIQWEVPVSPKGEREECTLPKKSVIINDLQEGDVVYFYVSSIPTNSGGTKARILLRGVIEAKPSVTSYNEVYVHEEEEKDKKIVAFSIGQLTTLPGKWLKDDNYLSREDILKRFGQIYPQGKRWPNKKTGNLDDGLIKELENIFKELPSKNDFSKLIEHFNQRCYFSGKIGTTNDHKTFKRRNGTDYYEYHHFIQQHKGKKICDGLNEITRDPRNIICLCSNCHNKIHYGTINEVYEMLKTLWEDKKIQEMLKEKNFQSLIGETEEPLKWIQSVYKLQTNVARSDNDNI